MKKYKLLRLRWFKVLAIAFFLLLLGAPNVFAVGASYTPKENINKNLTASTINGNVGFINFVGDKISSSWNSFTETISNVFESLFSINKIAPELSPTSSNPPITSIPPPVVSPIPTEIPTSIEIIPVPKQIIQSGLTGQMGPRGEQGPQGLTGLQGPRGEAGRDGNIVDTSSFVSRTFLDKQVNGIFDSISNSTQGLSSQLSEEVITKLLTVSGDATIGGNITITGNITGNVAGTINPSFTLGSIPFQGATGLAEDNANLFWDATNSRLGIGTTTPTAVLHLKAGTATLNTAPLKLTSGTNLTTTEAGAIEYNGSHLYFTAVDAGTRYQLDQSSPITVVNTSNLFSTGLAGTGSGVTTATNSNFFGVNAGSTATSAYRSNFFGYSAGNGATSASNSNFLGASAGSGATSASFSNFLGASAGQGASGANNSNFLGNQAGMSASSAYRSNFFGQNAGNGATSASNSNFFGQNAGNGATSASRSNFLGYMAGDSATNASFSNFLGYSAGSNATSASYSNFLGWGAGGGATSASNSIFIGQNAGEGDIVDNTTNGLSSILLGSFTNTGGFSNSILLGSGISGTPIVNTKANQFMLAPTVTEMQLSGIDYTLPSAQGAASTVLTNDGSGGLTWTSPLTPPITVVNTSNLFSTGLAGTGSGVTVATNSNFFGVNAGNAATDASGSNFFGESAGQNASYASYSNFLGYYAGSSAVNASNSNFFGVSAGSDATNAYESNFLGTDAGNGATSAYYSNFLGNSAGYQATTAHDSNFLGFGAGQLATSANYSNFLGYRAGYSATSASNSNFLGKSAGESASSASYSNLFGFNAGKFYTGNNIGSNNIIIGKNISLPNATANAINLGGVLFATGTYSIATGNPSITAVSGGKVGIGVVSPSTILEIGSSDLGDGVAGPIITLGRNTNATNTGAGSINFLGKAGIAGYVWQDAAGNMRIFTSAPTNTGDTLGTVIGAQTSTRDTKTEITHYTDYSRALAMITNAPLNTFRYIKEVDGYGTNSPLAKTRIGFIADEVDPMFMVGNSIDQVSVNGLLMASIKELDLKVNDLSSLDTTSETSLGSLITSFLADVGNGVTSIYASVFNAKEKICVDGECLTKEDIKALLLLAHPPINNNGANLNPPTCESPQILENNVCVNPPEETLTCESPQILVDNICTEPIPESEPTPADAESSGETTPEPTPTTEPAPDPVTTL